MKEYESQNPHVELNWVDLPQSASRQKLMAGIAAGEPPDLVNTSTEFALILAQYGAITKLSDMLTPDETSRYFPNLWKSTEYEGGVYAFPWYVTTKVVMYNKELLSEAGLDPEQPPETLEDLDQFARQVSQKTDAVGLMPSIRIWNDWAMEGAPIVDRETLEPLFTDPESVAVLERYHRLYEDKVMPPETLTEGHRGALDRYKAGSLAFLEAGPQFLLRIKADAPSVYKATGVAPMPRTKTDTLPAATMSFVVPRSVKHKEEAVKLGLFLTSPKAQLEFCKLVPILPSTVESAKDPFFETGGDDPLQAEAVRISLSQLPRARDFNLGLPRQKDLMRSLQNAVEQAIRGEKTTAEALGEAAIAWDRTLAPFRSSK
jgi:putative chitobiose transport system substrate-binding protein